MMEKNNYEQIIVLNSEIRRLQDKVNELKPNAIKELYEMGYSMDRIAFMLYTGKVNVIRVLHNDKVKINSVGRKRKEQTSKNGDEE